MVDIGMVAGELGQHDPDSTILAIRMDLVLASIMVVYTTTGLKGGSIWRTAATANKI